MIGCIYTCSHTRTRLIHAYSNIANIRTIEKISKIIKKTSKNSKITETSQNPRSQWPKSRQFRRQIPKILHWAQTNASSEIVTTYIPTRIMVWLLGFCVIVWFWKNSIFFFSKGLVLIARDVGLNLSIPRKKINVLLIGNHSAGWCDDTILVLSANFSEWKLFFQR